MKMKEDYHLQHVCSTLLKSQLYNIMTSINKKTTSKQTNKMTVSIILLLLGILTQKGHPQMMLHMYAFIRPFNCFFVSTWLLLKGSKQISIDTAGKSTLKLGNLPSLKVIRPQRERILYHNHYILNFKDFYNWPPQYKCL